MKKLIIVSALLCSLLFAPVFVSAQTATTHDALTQQLIQLLTQLIAQLEQQIATILAQQQTQIAAIQQQTQTIQQIQQNTQQIVQNTTLTPPPPIAPILGCMDSTATNYNSSANKDDGNCVYPTIKSTIATRSGNLLQEYLNVSADGDDFVVNQMVVDEPSHIMNMVYDGSGFNSGGMFQCDNLSQDIIDAKPSQCVNGYYFYVTQIPRYQFTKIIIGNGKTLMMNGSGKINLIYLNATGVKTGKIITLP